MPKETKKPLAFESIIHDTEMDEEFEEVMDKFKEKQLSPMEMDLKIQADRVVYILNRTLAKINIMAHLPMFLENDAELLRKYCNPVETYFILDILNKYGATFQLDNRHSDSCTEFKNILENVNLNINKNNATKVSLHSKISADTSSDPSIMQMIDILLYKKCLKQYVSNVITSKKVDVFLVTLLKVLQDFKNVVKTILYVTGDEEDVRDKELRRTYKANVLLTASIADLTEQLEKQRKELGDQLNQKVEIFEMYNNRMKMVKEDFEIKMRKSLIQSERRMMHTSLESEQKQAELAEESKRLTAQYESLLEEHLSQEKASRMKRLKAETQLQNWLTKFDQDIGERQSEYEVLKKEYDERKARMDELEDLLDNQEDEYNTLMEERDIEEARIYNEMAYQFLMNRSARIIQRYWRAYRERRALRKKGRKGKGKGGKKLSMVKK